MLEIALSLAILGIMFGISMPVYRIFMIRNDLDIATMTLVQDLRRAQTLSQVAHGDSTWGVHIGVGSILIFKGVSYAARDVSFDEDTSMPTSITVSGLNTIMFTKLTGTPQSTGTTTLTSSANEIRNITINEKGMVDY